jgi:hypothetical protein
MFQLEVLMPIKQQVVGAVMQVEYKQYLKHFKIS